MKAATPNVHIPKYPTSMHEVLERDSFFVRLGVATGAGAGSLYLTIGKGG